ncbi:MAG TPA: alanine racemase [Woeseiaceae bacterium]|nr:alanine racemase [Woeseiaceae bacterium]
MSFGARVRIRLGALQHNFSLLKEAAGGARICSVIKANAFGHGLLTVARGLPQSDSFAVARLSEARVLRDNDIDKPVVLLAGVMNADDLKEALRLDCELVVHNRQQLELLEALPAGAATVWLKVDTGMHRLGIDPTDAPAYLARLRACRAVRELRLMSHLANADNTSDPMTARQLACFRQVAADFPGDVSVANSAAILGWPEARAALSAEPSRVWVRPGIALYGISPFPNRCGNELGLQPVMEFESHLIAVKSVKEGAAVGYGGNWRAPRDTVVGIVSAGYGDGYPRFLPSGTPVLVNDRRVPLIGTISMDMLAVELGPDAEDQPGDTVLLWGARLPAEEVAACAGTIAYQLICGVTHRESSEVIPAQA